MDEGQSRPDAQRSDPAKARSAVLAAVARANRDSPHLRTLVARHPDVVDDVAAGTDAPEAFDDTLPAATALRRAKQREALRLALRDLAGLASLECVTAGLSVLADHALHRAIGAAIVERVPDACPRGFVAIALGKHGGEELNFSSDIDPILLFDPAHLPRRDRDDPADAAVRIARRVVELMQARDGDGYVFRVDLRLRPASEATPIALSIGAAIVHYESSALAWERAAFVRARAAAGDRALGEAFLDAIRPFIWRRSLDFGTVGDLQALTRQIRAHHGAAPFGPGFDLKRGRGGIREIEFFAQVHQLIHGGRDPSLRLRATLPALAALVAAGQIAADTGVALAAAYRLLRTIEHRVQMVDDRQTHQLPTGDALDGVARLHGLSDGGALLKLLRPHVARVEQIYDALAGTRDADLPAMSAALSERLAEAGFAAPEAAAGLIHRWRAGELRALRSAPAREALEAVLPTLVDGLSAAPDPDAALRRADRMIERLPSAINIFRLMEARPALAKLLATILSHAPALAEPLGRRPELLDGLIDATALEPQPDVAEIVRALGVAEPGEDYGTMLDRVRRAVNERRFALGVQIVGGAADPLDVAAGYARVAEGALIHLARATVAEHERAHGRVAGSELVVIALGRLGGGALTHASDLDLVYLFTGAIGGRSDGAKPLDTTRYFNRLAQKLSTALSVPTASGPLYQVDTRLRPSGMDGLLCASVDSFAAYQANDAWTWEHMALTRARTVFGSAAASAAVQAIVDSALRGSRNSQRLAADVVAMRAEMAAAKPAAGPLDVKLGAGGLVDLEFCVHYHQLRTHVGLTPRLDEAIVALVATGALPAGFVEAQKVLSRLLVALRLVSPGGEAIALVTRALVARACGSADWQALLAATAAARQMVGDAWARIVEESAND